MEGQYHQLRPGIDQQHFEKNFQLFQTRAPRDRVESTGVGLRW